MKGIISHPIQISFIFLLSIFLFACGGENEQPPAQDLILDPIPTNTFDITTEGPSSAAEGQKITLSASPSTGNISDYSYSWHQSSGPKVDFANNVNKIEFTTPFVKNNAHIQFDVAVTNTEGELQWSTHTIAITNEFELQTTYKEVTNSIFKALSNTLQLTYLARDSIQYNQSITDAKENSCSNGGFETITLIDSDSSKTLSSGDQLKLDYIECKTPLFQSLVDGSLTIDIKKFDPSTQDLQVSIDTKNIDFNSNTPNRFESKLSISITNTDTTRSISINSTEQGAYVEGTKELFTFSDIALIREVDLKTAKYSVSFSGKIDDKILGGSYTIEQTTALSGYLYEYPNEGELTIKSGDNDTIKIQSNFVVDSAQVNITTSNSTFESSWREYKINGIWVSGDNYTRSPQPFRSDNFTHIGLVGDKSNISLTQPVHFLFSRPIESIEDIEVYFETTSSPRIKTQATAEIKGALLSITPLNSLQSSTEYRIRSIRAYSKFGKNASTNTSTLKTNNHLKPEITASSLLFTYDSTPTLNATQSIINRGSAISYQWKEISNNGVIFASPSSESTSFTVPSDISNDIEIELTLTNNYGDIAATRLALVYMPDDLTYLFYDSEEGDYIGAGQTNVHTTNQGTIGSSISNDKNLIQFNFNGGFNGGSNNWNFRIAAPQGEPLAIKRYTGATRLPFQSATEPGLSLSGNGRGCNNSYGEFEILELEVNGNEIIQLAVDFIQHCESTTAPALRGAVRINSELKSPI